MDSEDGHKFLKQQNLKSKNKQHYTSNSKLHNMIVKTSLIISERD